MSSSALRVPVQRIVPGWSACDERLWAATLPDRGLKAKGNLVFLGLSSV
jgi:hypothetical protein